MAKTFAEIRDELRALKDEIYMNGANADTKLIAGYLDQLVQSLEGLTETLEAMEASMDCACECCESCAMPAPSKAKPKAKPKKAAKKPAKKKRR